MKLLKVLKRYSEVNPSGSCCCSLCVRQMGGGPRSRPQHDVRRQDQPETSSQTDAEKICVVEQKSPAVMDHSSEPGETSKIQLN